MFAHYRKYRLFRRFLSASYLGSSTSYKKTRIKKYELFRTFFNSIIAIHKHNLLTIFFGQVSIIEHHESKRKL